MEAMGLSAIYLLLPLSGTKSKVGWSMPLTQEVELVVLGVQF